MENDGHYNGIAEALSVMPFGVVGLPIEDCSPSGLFPMKAFSCPGGDSQMKLSMSGPRLLLLALQPLYISPVGDIYFHKLYSPIRKDIA